MSQSKKDESSLIFSGVRSQFNEWEKFIRATVIGVRAHNIVFPDVNGGYEELKEPPENPGPEANQVEFANFKYADEKIEKFNKAYEEREAAAFRVIKDNLDVKLLDLILPTNGDPRAAFLILREKFSLNGNDIHAVALEKQKFQKMKQKDNDLFSTFWISFEHQRIKAMCSEDDALAKLTDRDPVLNPLPKRLYGDAEKCRKDRYTYAATVKYLSEEDQSNLETNVFKVTNSVKRMRRDAEDEPEDEVEPKNKARQNQDKPAPSKPCPGCGNPGHLPRDCKLDACSFCKKWNCGHNSFNCPARLESYKNKKARGDPNRKAAGKETVRNDKKKTDEKPPRKGKDFKKKRSGYRVKKSSASDDESDTEDSESEESESDEVDEDDRPATIRVRFGANRVSVRKLGPKVFNNPKKSKFMMRVDTGADVSCAPSPDILREIAHDFSSAKDQKENQVHVADGRALKCTAKGDVDDYITDVHILPGLDESLLAVAPLQQKGLWTILPPGSADLRHSCYMVDCEGRIVYAADDNLMVDLQAVYDEYPRVTLPVIHDTAAEASVRRMGVYGFNATSLNELVSFWHNALGHPSMEKMCEMVDKQLVVGVNLTAKQIRAHWIDCIHCIKGKMTKRPNRGIPSKAPVVSVSVGDVVARDIYITGALKGPGNLSSFETYVDLKSGFLKPMAVHVKSDVLDNTKKINAFYGRYGHEVRVLKSDSERVYKSEKMKTALDEMVIEPQYDPPYTHATLIEIRHRIAGNKVTSMFSAAPHVPHELFFEAVKTFCHTENLFSHPNSDGKSAYELFTGVKPDLAKFPLLPFGTPVEVWVPAEQRHGKFEDKSVTCMYLGIEEGTIGAIRVYNPITKTIFNRDQYTVLPFVPPEWPIYNKAMKAPRRVPQVQVPTIEALPEVKPEVPEDEVPVPADQEGVVKSQKPVIAPDQEGGVEVMTDRDDSKGPVGDQEVPLTPTAVNEIAPATTVETAAAEKAQVTPATRSGRPVKPPSRFAKAAKKEREAVRIDIERHVKPSKYQNGAVKHQRRKQDASNCVRKVKSKVRTADNPTFKRAIDPSNPDCERWKKAIDIEDQQMEDERVYDTAMTADMTPKEKVEAIRTHYELVAKRDADGKIEKYKARLVANGNTQSESTYDDIKSPTARSASVKLAMAIAAKKGFKLRVFDVKGAYLKVKVKPDTRIFVRLPDGRLARLLKYLYGLKQSGLEWHLLLKSLLIKWGYKQSEADNCVFTYMKGNDYVNIVLHVDDLFCTASSDWLLDNLYRSLKREFGEVTQKSGSSFTYLGMKVTITRKGILLSQPGAIDKLVKAADLIGCSPAATPETLIPTEIKGGEESVDQTEYLRLLGMINHIAIQTRPELLHSLSKLAKIASSPNRQHMHNLKRVVRYLSGTRDLGLFFRRSGKIKLTCMVDASYNSSEDAKGQTGYVFMIGDVGDAVFFARSAKQKCVVLSSTESEYVALSEVCTEVIWFRQLMKDMGFPQDEPTTVYEDNMATIKIAYGAGTHQRTKHINVRYHFTRQAIAQKIIAVKHMSTKNMLADILTKELPREQFEKLRNGMLQSYY